MNTNPASEISYEELLRLRDKKEYVLIDIRSKYEYEKEHIRGSISIPEHELFYEMNRFDKRKTYIFICQKGKNSRDVAHTFKQYGYKTINLAKGMDAVR